MSEIENVVDQAEPQAESQKPAEPTPNPLLEKALKEKNNWKLRAQELEQKNQELVDAQLKEKEDFKSLYESSQQKLNELNTKLETERKEKEDGFKISAVKKELQKMGADPAYADTLLQLADINSLKYEPEHRIVLGAEDMAKSIKEKLPIAFGGVVPKTDNSAPNNNIADITMDAYKKMTPEQRKDPKVKEALYKKYGHTVRK